MTNFTEEEITQRRELVKPIVEGAYSIRTVLLSDEKLNELAKHWEMSLANVPTNQLRKLYRDGLQRRCTTVEQFALVYEMKVENMAMRLQYQAQQDAAKSKPTNNSIPEDILKRWEAAGSKSQ